MALRAAFHGNLLTGLSGVVRLSVGKATKI